MQIHAEGTMPWFPRLVKISGCSQRQCYEGNDEAIIMCFKPQLIMQITHIKWMRINYSLCTCLFVALGGLVDIRKQEIKKISIFLQTPTKCR